LVGVDLDQQESPVETDEALEKFINELKANPPDAVIVTLQHMSNWKRAEKITELGIPTIIFAPIGT
ncbi:MAG: hypothetical protein KC964_22735, partial [Candidatus Omnitrophica bacterium]|nr:hypothetical protein [Candidatus Omnitrophota bacterium]